MRFLLNPRQSVELYFTPSAVRRAFRRTNRRFEFQERRQFVIGTHNVTFAITAMRVSNPDHSPVGINR
ncbi:MAG: hypothetical protein WA849_13295 [Candidatus Udaeobacter sp.]